MFTFRELAADNMLLYKHSTCCSSAMQIFLDCNPQYWYFVPMSKMEAQAQNLGFDLSYDYFIRGQTSSSSSISNIHTNREVKASSNIQYSPPIPPENYTFSAYQHAKQLQLIKDKHNQLVPNSNLDLYNTTIVAICK